MKTKAEVIRAIKSAGFSVNSLLSIESDAKTVKGSKKGYLTGVCYLMPDDRLCPMADLAGCREACLVSAGRAAFTPGIGQARAERSRLFHEQKELFFTLLKFEIEALQRKADKRGLIPAVRLNGTSDINYTRFAPYNGHDVFEYFSDVQFYEYTKSPSIIRAYSVYDNVSVTASYSEADPKYRDLIKAAAIKYGVNLAVVFSGMLPAYFNGLPVINGDETDLRFTDSKGVVVGLKAKGKAKKDNSGFVIAIQA